MLRGIIKDDVINKGFDQLDGENFSDWFARHGGSMLTISSPLSMNTPNLSYQYPDGDTTRSPQMAAGAYLHRSEEHTSELQSLMRISYAVFCLKKKQKHAPCLPQSGAVLPRPRPNSHVGAG